MLRQRIGFVGAGNMTRAILSGILKAGLVDRDQVMVSDVKSEQRETVERSTQCETVDDNATVVERSDVVIFAVKPFNMADVCNSVRSSVNPDKLFVSICAGIPTAFIEERLGDGIRVVRVMPNTPALLGCGAAGVAPGKNASRADLDLVLSLFQSVGTAVILGEDKLDLVTGLTGSGPAYVFYFAESLIQAGVKLGLSEEDASELVTQTVLGAARMAIESGKPLGELRAAVTTKRGTTEAGLNVLEEAGFADIVCRCVDAATRRSAELSKGQ
jgi:pyrroline-5-carboxylate reductase